MGLVGPDEPRYAAIGRAMATSGDWITPRLWGEGWFEKPVLAYWMTALGFQLRLGTELAPRLPVALIGAAFLFLYYRLLREHLEDDAALCATVVLATSAGWLAFSHVAVMDVPLTASYAAAMLLAYSGRRLAWAGALFGIAMLAKGLVPLVLAAPLVFWYRRARPLPIVIALLAVALPWYALCYAANGRVFFDEFIWKHHFARFFSRSLEHVQPVWFYVPVMLAWLFPWTPLVALLRRPADDFQRFLWAWFGFGFVFWSASVNKLPGYVVTLLPPLAALIGIGFARTRAARPLLVACALLLSLAGVVAEVLPQAIEVGVRKTQWTAPPAAVLAAAIALSAAVWMLDPRRAVAAIALAVAAGVWGLTTYTYPNLDAALSARPRWLALQSQAAGLCFDDPHRDLRYGLNYYAGRALPDCDQSPKPVRVR